MDETTDETTYETTFETTFETNDEATHQTAAEATFDVKQEYKKSPVGAALLSIFPGAGFFYIGNFLKGITYMMVFISLIVLAANSHGFEIAVFVLMCVGFYLFQIFDCYDETQKMDTHVDRFEESKKKFTLISAWTILVLGLIFQLANLGVLRLGNLTRFWPMILVGLGAKLIYDYSKKNEINEGE
ncbi:MAG: hypothetical protein GY757_60340 [bacterium]|nr:hypothetical protein [bacterium]